MLYGLFPVRRRRFPQICGGVIGWLSLALLLSATPFAGAQDPTKNAAKTKPAQAKPEATDDDDAKGKGKAAPAPDAKPVHRVPTTTTILKSPRCFRMRFFAIPARKSCSTSRISSRS